MTRKFAALFVLSCFWLWVGCAAVIIGTGLGVGTYTYLKGDLKRAYNAKFDQTLNVCLSILTDLINRFLKKPPTARRQPCEPKEKTAPRKLLASLYQVLIGRKYLYEPVFLGIGIERYQSSFMNLSQKDLNGKVKRFRVQSWINFLDVAQMAVRG